MQQQPIAHWDWCFVAHFVNAHAYTCTSTPIMNSIIAFQDLHAIDCYTWLKELIHELFILKRECPTTTTPLPLPLPLQSGLALGLQFHTLTTPKKKNILQLPNPDLQKWVTSYDHEAYDANFFQKFMKSPSWLQAWLWSEAMLYVGGHAGEHKGMVLACLFPWMIKVTCK